MAITAWTNRFHVALLREFALMEAVVRNQRSGRRVQEFRSPTFYFPLFDRPGRGAWGAVVEPHRVEWRDLRKAGRLGWVSPSSLWRW